MSLYLNNIETVAQEIGRQTEDLLLDQLNDLVSRDLLVVEYGPISLVQDQYSYRISIKRTVKLTLKDKEYIQKLEQENEELKKFIASFKETYEKFST